MSLTSLSIYYIILYHLYINIILVYYVHTGTKYARAKCLSSLHLGVTDVNSFIILFYFNV